MENESLKSELGQFTGTENYHKHLNIILTDGALYLAEKAQAFWLLDAIASYQDHEIRKLPFQLWELNVNDDRTCVLTMKEDKNEPLLVEQRIPYTDFPLDDIRLYLIDRVLLLPSEY